MWPYGDDRVSSRGGCIQNPPQNAGTRAVRPLLEYVAVVVRRFLPLVAVSLTVAAAAAVGGFLALRMNRADRAISTVGAPNPPALSGVEDPRGPEPPTPAPVPSVPVRTAKRTQPSQTRSAPPSAAAADPLPTGSPAPPAISTAVMAPPVTTAPPAEVPVAASATVTDPAPVAVAVQTPRFEELVLDTDSVIGIRLESTLSSQTAHVEDKVTAVVTRDVTVADRTVIPAGTILDGVVQSVEAGGKFKTQARLGLRFNRVLMPDNSRVSIQTETIFREAESPANEAAAKVGASAVVGSIIGGLIGGKKGALIGAGAGAAGGTAVVAAKDPNAVVMSSGTLLTVRLTAPAKFTVQRDE